MARAISLEAWRAAVRMLDDHGSSADDHALAKLRELCLGNDLSALRDWSAVLAAMNELRRDRQEGERAN